MRGQVARSRAVKNCVEPNEAVPRTSRSLRCAGGINTMQPLTAIRASDTSTTLPLACLLSAASAHPSISTGKQRDSETGNDYFGARYYSSDAGRFLSPDWAAKAEPVPYAKLNNPQSLNLYDYVGDNPTSNVDATGHGGCSGKYSAICAAITEALVRGVQPEVAMRAANDADRWPGQQL